MELKKFFVNKLILFFLLSTLITAAVSLIGSAFDGDAQLGYRDMLTPMRYAALCMLPSLVMYARHELSPKQMLFRKALMLLLLEAAILLIAFTSDAIDTDRIEVILVIAGSVLVIFALANLFLWWKDTAEAKKLNQELAAYQALHT